MLLFTKKRDLIQRVLKAHHLRDHSLTGAYWSGYRGGGSHIDMVYVYVSAFWGAISRNLV